MTSSQNESTPLDPEQLWAAVLARDHSFDGRFVYAVRSTGVYCRPTCPSRRPRQSQAVFFQASEEARSAGFRACQRCKPDSPERAADLVLLACQYIDYCLEGIDPVPTLAEIAEVVGVSEYRIRKLFKQHTGITPYEYAQVRRMELLKTLLPEYEDVASAAYNAGYGSSSRLYESATRRLGMTPASYRKGGAGAVIRFMFNDSALGGLLIAGTIRGVCAIKLGDDSEVLISELRDEFPAAEIRRVEPEDPDPETVEFREWVGDMMEYLEGRTIVIDLPLDVLATAFQWQVWRQLRAIPAGETRTYQQLAEELDHPTASRAVGRACATNPVAPVIPCHRAVRKDGGLAGYRWGLHRKEALLAMERRQHE